MTEAKRLIITMTEKSEDSLAAWPRIEAESITSLKYSKLSFPWLGSW
jgi:hypothetical protein